MTKEEEIEIDVETVMEIGIELEIGIQRQKKETDMEMEIEIEIKKETDMQMEIEIEIEVDRKKATIFLPRAMSFQVDFRSEVNSLRAGRFLVRLFVANACLPITNCHGYEQSPYNQY